MGKVARLAKLISLPTLGIIELCNLFIKESLVYLVIDGNLYWWQFPCRSLSKGRNYLSSTVGDVACIGTSFTTCNHCCRFWKQRPQGVFQGSGKYPVDMIVKVGNTINNSADFQIFPNADYFTTLTLAKLWCYAKKCIIDYPLPYKYDIVTCSNA